jgi:hypothetical protein
MDGLKLDKWRNTFTSEVQNLQTEFDAFFLTKKLDEFYTLKVDEASQTLLLEITNKDELPKEIEDRLTQIYFRTQPEDSV